MMNHDLSSYLELEYHMAEEDKWSPEVGTGMVDKQLN